MIARYSHAQVPILFAYMKRDPKERVATIRAYAQAYTQTPTPEDALMEISELIDHHVRMDGLHRGYGMTTKTAANQVRLEIKELVRSGPSRSPGQGGIYKYLEDTDWRDVDACLYGKNIWTRLERMYPWANGVPKAMMRFIQIVYDSRELVPVSKWCELIPIASNVGIASNCYSIDFSICSPLIDPASLVAAVAEGTFWQRDCTMTFLACMSRLAHLKAGCDACYKQGAGGGCLQNAVGISTAAPKYCSLTIEAIQNMNPAMGYRTYRGNSFYISTERLVLRMIESKETTAEQFEEVNDRCRQLHSLYNNAYTDEERNEHHAAAGDQITSLAQLRKLYDEMHKIAEWHNKAKFELDRKKYVWPKKLTDIVEKHGWYLPTSRLEMKERGNKHHNCVGGYGDTLFDWNIADKLAGFDVSPVKETEIVRRLILFRDGEEEAEAEVKWGLGFKKVLVAGSTVVQGFICPVTADAIIQCKTKFNKQAKTDGLSWIISDVYRACKPVDLVATPEEKV